LWRNVCWVNEESLVWRCVFCVIFCVILYELLPTAFCFFAFSLLSLLFVCYISLYIYVCMFIFFSFFCYHKLVNKDLYIKIFTHLWEINIFVLGYFLARPVGCRPIRHTTCFRARKCHRVAFILTPFWGSNGQKNHFGGRGGNRPF